MAQEPKQSKRLTMVELAKEAGVSTTTVSKVFNQLPGVGAQTRARIQQLIEQNASIKRASLLLSLHTRELSNVCRIFTWKYRCAVFQEVALCGAERRTL